MNGGGAVVLPEAQVDLEGLVAAGGGPRYAGAMFCRSCGHRNPPRSAYCASCGTKLESELAEETTASFSAVDDEEAPFSPGELPEHAALLVVARGPNAGSRYLLDQDLVRVGRHPDADILLDDITVSRKHVELQRDADGFAVRDVGSLNGTYLNRQRVDEARLRTGDELQVGRFRLRFYGGDEVDASR